MASLDVDEAHGGPELFIVLFGGCDRVLLLMLPKPMLRIVSSRTAQASRAWAGRDERILFVEMSGHLSSLLAELVHT